ncbi:flagellinolysin [Chitinibacteraceae bacterium HSL-7]
MQINTNLAAINAQRALSGSQSGLERALTRLSSGLRINTARDDAAGLAISERMNTQIRGNGMAWRNTNDAVSLVQTAEGAFSTVAGILQRVRELAVQAANATNSADDKAALQAEANQLLQNIDQMGAQTVFNGKQIFSQSTASLSGDKAKRAVLDGLQVGWLEASERRVLKYFGIKADGVDLTVVFDPPSGSGLSSAPGGVAAAVGSLDGTADGAGRTNKPFLYIDMADFTPPNLPNGGGIDVGNGTVYNDRIIAHEMVHAIMGRSMSFAGLPSWFKEGMAEFIHGADERVWGDTAQGTDASAAVTAFQADDVSGSQGYTGGYLAVKYLHQQIKAAGGAGIRDITEYLASHSGSTLDDAITNGSSGAFANLSDFNTRFASNANSFLATLDLTNDDTGAIGGFDTDGGAILTAKSVIDDNDAMRSGEQVMDGFHLIYPDNGGATGLNMLTFQIGANAGETLTTQVGAVSSTALGVDDVDLTELAKFAIYKVDRALEFIGTQRASLGAMQSRLESTMTTLSVQVENDSAARSRIRDADYAQETASLTRQQILQQAGTAMLSQANNQPQLALQLLR